MSESNGSLLPSIVGRRYAARLGLALAFAVIVMLAFGLVISIQASETLEEDVETDMLGLAESQAGEFDGWLENTERSIRAASDDSAFETTETAEIRDRLYRLVETEQTSAHVTAIQYLDAETMTIEASSDEAFEGTELLEAYSGLEQELQTVEGEHDTHISEPFTVDDVDGPVVMILSPITDTEDRWLMYTVDLQAQAEQTTTRGDTETTLVDAEGAYLTHPNTNLLGDSSGYEEELLDGVQTGDAEFVERDDDVAALAGLESTDWTVVVSTDSESAFALSDQINSNLLGLIFLAIINLGLVGVTVGANTVTSLRRLSSSAREMGDGNLDVDLSSSREDEIGVLYASFDRMRTSLREQIREAESAREDAEEARQSAEEARKEAKTQQERAEQRNEELEAKATEYRSVLGDVAAGELTRRVDPSSSNASMQAVGEELNTTLDALEETISTTKSFATDVRESSELAGRNADRVGEASATVRNSTREIFDGASQQRQQLEMAASEMEELSATAEEVASSAQQVAQTSQAAAEVGETGRKSATEAIEEMNAIDEETDRTVEEISALADDLQEIGNIVDLITEIVEQTNMLALNASIEAARADAGGEGFAVVADEIKNLAEETRDAAGDIENRIERIQNQADDTVETIETTSERITNGTETVEDAIEALEQIVEYTEEVDVGIQEIDQATEEQARTAQRVMGVIDDLNDISQETESEAEQVANTAQEQTDAIEEVATSAQSLHENAEALTELLARFTVAEAGQSTTETAIERSTGGEY